MKAILFSKVATMWVMLQTCAHAQGVFGNLNFESATVSNLPSGSFNYANVPVTNAFPLWTAYYGTNQTALVSQNTISLGEVNISILGPSYNAAAIIQGNYTAVLQAGGSSFQVPASLAQTGLIPTGSQSLQFSAFATAGALQVTFNGQNIPFIPLAAGSNYELYGGDISAFAGMAGELRFTIAPTVSQPFSAGFLDNILFSTQPVPEPGTCALILCGAGFLAIHRWRKHPKTQLSTARDLDLCCGEEFCNLRLAGKIYEDEGHFDNNR